VDRLGILLHTSTRPDSLPESGLRLEILSSHIHAGILPHCSRAAEAQYSGLPATAGAVPKGHQEGSCCAKNATQSWICLQPDRGCGTTRPSPSHQGIRYIEIERTAVWLLISNRHYEDIYNTPTLSVVIQWIRSVLLIILYLHSVAMYHVLINHMVNRTVLHEQLARRRDVSNRK